MQDLLIYIPFLITLFAIATGYLYLARKKQLVDNPNERSSHTVSTIRGGGILFPVSILLFYFFFGFNHDFFVLGLVLISIISFIDDRYTISTIPRIIVQTLSAALLFYELNLYNLEWYLIFVSFILLIGWINAFNFMDGINGISSLYALSVLLSVYLVSEQGIPFYHDSLLVMIGLGILVFSYFNFRKRAIVFAGDVGSVSMAFILAFLLITVIRETGSWEYIFFLSLYGIDTVLTIVQRLLLNENIFKAHRSHLYQVFANESGISHRIISIAYAICQVSFNIILIQLIENDYKSLWSISLCLIQLIIYVVLKLRLMKKYNLALFKDK